MVLFPIPKAFGADSAVLGARGWSSAETGHRISFGEARVNKIDEHLTRPASDILRPGEAQGRFRSLHRRLEPKRPVDHSWDLQLGRPVRHEREADPSSHKADHGLPFGCFENNPGFFAVYMEGAHDRLVTVRPHLSGRNDQ